MQKSRRLRIGERQRHQSNSAKSKGASDGDAGAGSAGSGHRSTMAFSNPNLSSSASSRPMRPLSVTSAQVASLAENRFPGTL